MCQHNVFTSYDCPDCLKARITELEAKLEDALGKVSYMVSADIDVQNKLQEQAERVAELEREIECAVRYLESCGYGSGKLIQEGEPEAQMLAGFKKALRTRQVTQESYPLIKGSAGLGEGTAGSPPKQSRQRMEGILVDPAVSTTQQAYDPGEDYKDLCPHGLVANAPKYGCGICKSAQQAPYASDIRTKFYCPGTADNKHEFTKDSRLHCIFCKFKWPCVEATVQGTKPSGGMRLGMNEYEHAKCKHEWRMAHPETGKCIHCTAAERTAQGVAKDG